MGASHARAWQCLPLVAAGASAPPSPTHAKQRHTTRTQGQAAGAGRGLLGGPGAGARVQPRRPQAHVWAAGLRHPRQAVARQGRVVPLLPEGEEVGKAARRGAPVQQAGGWACPGRTCWAKGWAGGLLPSLLGQGVGGGPVAVPAGPKGGLGACCRACWAKGWAGGLLPSLRGQRVGGGPVAVPAGPACVLANLNT